MAVKRRDPCPACEGRGVDVDPRNPDVIRGACVACSGTRLRPVTTFVRATREHHRGAAMRRKTKGQ